MGIFNKMRGGAGAGRGDNPHQQAYVPGAVNSFASPGYGKTGKPMAPKNMAYEQGEHGDTKKDVWGKATPAKSAPQSNFQENDDWLK